MENFRQDLLYGIRSWVKSPGFAVISTVTLALAIAVNTAIFSLINVIVFADLPMENPEEVARVRSVLMATRHKRRIPLAPKLGIKTVGWDWRE